MFLVYIDGFMSSNPSWHQPNPRYQQQQGVPPPIFMAPAQPRGDPHLYGTQPTPGTNPGCHLTFMVPTTKVLTPTPWRPPNPRYQQQQQGAPPHFYGNQQQGNKGHPPLMAPPPWYQPHSRYQPRAHAHVFRLPPFLWYQQQGHHPHGTNPPMGTNPTPGRPLIFMAPTQSQVPTTTTTRGATTFL